MGNRHRNACPSNIYSAADGEILIFCLAESHWHTVAKLMRREDLIGSERFKDHAARFAIADEVDAIVSAWTRAHRRDELVETLLERGVPCAPVRSIAEVVADPEVQRRRMLIDSEFPARGKIRVLGSPLKLSAAGDTAPTRPPALGEHTAEILMTVGIDDAALAHLRDDGVV